MGGMGDVTSLLKQAQLMKEEMTRVQDGLRERIIEGTAGGGAVRVQVNGNMDPVAVKIDPAALKPDEAEVLEDLILAATRQAMEKAREVARAELGKLTGGLSLPGIF